MTLQRIDVHRKRDGLLVWSCYRSRGASVRLPPEVQDLLDDGSSTLTIVNVEPPGPSLASRLAALPIRGLDWLLRKAIR